MANPATSVFAAPSRRTVRPAVGPPTATRTARGRNARARRADPERGAQRAQERERGVDDEGGPPRRGGQQTAEDGAGGEAGRPDRTPDGEGPAALVPGGEGRADQAEDRGLQQR